MLFLFDSAKLFFKSKILFIMLCVTSVYVIASTAIWYGKPQSATEPLANAMTFTVYMYILMMFVSYEFFRKYNDFGIAEAINVSPEGRKGKHSKGAFLFLSLYSFLFSIIVCVIVIIEFLFFKIKDPNHEYIYHIIKAVVLNYFLVMELGIIVGDALSNLKYKAFSYVVMTFFSIMVSAFPQQIAYMILTSQGENAGAIAYEITSFFNVIPKLDLYYLTLAEFGENILPYRFFLIGFWGLLFGIVITIKKKYYRKFICPVSILCVACLAGYLYPSSRVDLGLNPNSCLSNISYYYYYNYDNVTKDEKADYEISKYDMELSIKLNLSAKVNMEVSKSLDEYKMTLFHDYKISYASNQDGDKLDFTQDGDYVRIINSENKKITNIILEYKGSSATYYANSQGCFLPGYFAYYPRAGYLPLYNQDKFDLESEFVDEDTYFEVKIDYGKKIISNLDEENGVYKGKSDGFTMVSGFYKMKDLGNGNTLVYPYMDNNILHDGIKIEDELWKKEFEISENTLKETGRKNTMIFTMPKMNFYIDAHSGKNQVFSRESFFYTEEN